MDRQVWPGSNSTTSVTHGVAQALLTDQLDYVGIGSIRPENFPLFEGNDDFTFLVQASGGQTNLVMDTTVAPYDDIRVRQAFKLLMDRQEILEVVYAGQRHRLRFRLEKRPLLIEQDCPRDSGQRNLARNMSSSLWRILSFVRSALSLQGTGGRGWHPGRDQPGA